MKKLSMLLLVLGLAGLLIPSLVYGQQLQQAMRRFEQEYKTTDEVIVRVRSIIASSGIDRGRELLNLAEKIQTQAKNMGMNQNFAGGITFTLKAREQAKSAGLVNQQAKEDESLVRRQLEKTDQLLERVRTSLAQDMEQNIESLYNAALDNQRRAQEFYHNHQLRPALKLSRQVENTLKRLIEKFKEMNGNVEHFRIQINRMQNKIDRIEGIVGNCGSEQAGQMFGEIKEQFENLINFQQTEPSARLENRLRLMNQHLNTVVELCQGLEVQLGQLNRLKAEMEQSASDIGNSGNDRANRLFAQARKQLEKAEQFCNSGDSESCAANIKAAQISLRKAKQLAGL